MRLWWPFKPDWHAVVPNETRWRPIRTHGQYVVEERQRKFINMKTGTLAWRPDRYSDGTVERRFRNVAEDIARDIRG